MSENDAIINCEFVFKCPRRWDDLTPTEDRDVRHCAECNQPVRFLHTADEFERFSNDQKCFAANMEDPETGVLSGSTTIGLIDELSYQHTSETKVFLEPVAYLSPEQLRVVRRLSGLTINMLETQRHFANGERHFLIVGYSPGQLGEIISALEQARVPYSTEAT